MTTPTTATPALTESDRRLSIASLRLQILRSWYALQEAAGELAALSEGEASEALGVPLATIRTWENAWRDGGLQAVAAL